MKSRVSWSYESNELLDVVESFLHNIVTPCPQLCGRHTGGWHHPLSSINVAVLRYRLCDYL